MEIYKRLPDYPGLMISNKGNIRRNGKDHVHVSCSGGYRTVSINGGTLSIHRLVAFAFVPLTGNAYCVHHRDFNPSNNTASNLQWLSRKRHMIIHRDKSEKPDAHINITTLTQVFPSTLDANQKRAIDALYIMKYTINKIAFIVRAHHNTVKDYIKNEMPEVTKYYWGDKELMDTVNRQIYKKPPANT